ncbi:hypothetical protein D1AOALGA4SA_7933 [Olavius algarvensis Delta 1 endosymbiont]|nr:hypothetical protein D1AOALGA4SA_7933 [Olavius algarvensis Delta 1 endosymbiont]
MMVSGVSVQVSGLGALVPWHLKPTNSAIAATQGPLLPSLVS